MNGETLYFSKGFILNVKQNDVKTVSASKFSYDISGNLEQLSVFSWNPKAKADILAVANVKEKLTGKSILTSLVCVDRESKLTKPTLDCFIVNINPVTEKFVPLRKFTLKSRFLNDIFSENCLLQLADGPSAVVCQKSNIYFYRDTLDGSHTLEPTVHSLDPACRVSRIILTHYCQNRKCHLIMFEVKTCEELKNSTLKTVTFLCLCIKGDHTNEINSCLLIPLEYAACISSSSVASFALDSTQTGVKSEIFIGTSEGFLVQFKDGQIQRCIQVFERAVSFIHVQSTPSGKAGPLENYILVGSQSTYKFLNAFFKVQGEAIKARHCVSGDFLQRGEDQYLFLEGDIENTTSALLYDMHRPPNKSDGTNKEDCAASQVVCRALKNRVQMERISNTERSQELRQLQSFTRDTLERHLAKAEGSLCPRDRISRSELVPLVESEATYNYEGHVHEGTTSKPEIQLLRHWQRTYHGQWCIGLDFTCYTQQPVRMWLDVIPMKQSSPAVTSSRSPSVVIKAQAMQRKTSDFGETDLLAMSEKCATPARTGSSDSCPTKCTVTCALAIPAMDTDRVECSLILNWHTIPDWTENDNVEFDAGDKADDFPLNVRIYSKPCGSAVLCATDVVDGKYEIDVMKGANMSEDVIMDDLQGNIQDSIALEVVEVKTLLIMRASVGVLCTLESILTSRCGFLHNTQLACYVCNQGPLAGNQLKLGDRKQAECRDLVLYTRSNKEVLLMIHYMYSKLPDEVVIECVPENTRATNSRRLTALQKEVEFLQRELRAVSNEHERLELSDTDEDDLKTVGEKFKRQQDKLRSMESKTVDFSANPNFLRKLRYLRIQTDTAFLDLK